MALSKQQRMAMIDFLVPLLNDEGKRQLHMDLLFAGESRRPDLNLQGAPRETTTRIVLVLETYHIASGKPALVDLLQQVSYDVGVDHQSLIEEWKNALLATVPLPFSSVPSIPQAMSFKPIELERRISTPLHSRAESFVIPAPFAWILIPAGNVTLEAKNESYLKTETSFNMPAFMISKYPITVEQYKLFAESGGYHDKQWWTKQAWKSLFLDKANASQSEKFWANLSETRPEEYPATVTWYEAMAFCSWLSAKISYTVYLPTEQQWQRAAQGDEGYSYPWGNHWNPDLCNNQSDSFTPVDKYERWGSSPYGAADMVGNAAEWTVTSWKTGEQADDTEDARVVRGGSYSSEHLNFLRVTTRHKEWPTVDCGFRLVRLLE